MMKNMITGVVTGRWTWPTNHSLHATCCCRLTTTTIHRPVPHVNIQLPVSTRLLIDPSRVAWWC